MFGDESCICFTSVNSYSHQCLKCPKLLVLNEISNADICSLLSGRIFNSIHYKDLDLKTKQKMSNVLVYKQKVFVNCWDIISKERKLSKVLYSLIDDIPTLDTVNKCYHLPLDIHSHFIEH